MNALRISTRTFLILALLGACALYAVPASAHVTGASFSATTTPYVIDLGYDPVAATAGMSERFDFVLRDEKTGNSVPFDQVWLRIKQGSETKLATGIFRQPLGPTTLLYVFDEPGTYTLEPSFRDAEGNEIAVTTFPITVAQGGDKPYLLYAALVVSGAALGILLSSVRKVRRS